MWFTIYVVCRLSTEKNAFPSKTVLTNVNSHWYTMCLGIYISYIHVFSLEFFCKSGWILRCSICSMLETTWFGIHISRFRELCYFLISVDLVCFFFRLCTVVWRTEKVRKNKIITPLQTHFYFNILAMVRKYTNKNHYKLNSNLIFLYMSINKSNIFYFKKLTCDNINVKKTGSFLWCGSIYVTRSLCFACCPRVLW